MATLKLTQKIVASTECPKDQKKIDLFDQQVTGLVLEIRISGGRTYYLRYRNERNRTRLIKLGIPSEISLKNVRLKAQKLKTQIALGEDPLATKRILQQVPTFHEFFHERYLPYAKSYKRSWKTDESIANNHLLKHFKNKHLDEITSIQVRDIHQALLDKGSAPATANRVLVLLRYIYNLAIKWEVIGVTKNPTHGIPLFQVNNKHERYLTEQQIECLYYSVQASENNMLEYIVSLLIVTGARRNEVLQAQWDQFDFKNRSWRIPITKNGKARHIPISDSMERVLDRIKSQHFSNRYVLPNPKTGKPFQSIFYSWDKARKRCDLEHVRLHDLRHTFASLLVNNGRTLYEVQKLLGHSQIQTTQRYAHLSEKTLLDATNEATKGLKGIF